MDRNNIKKAIQLLEKEIKTPDKGIPEELFLYVSNITPMVNVDLLIKDGRTRTLLSWRDDEFCGAGWHVPGGIVRHNETFLQRVKKVVDTEIFMNVDIKESPLELNELIRLKSEYRSHFISILYHGYVKPDLPVDNRGKKENDAGYLKWFEKCPKNLISVHEIYRKYI